MRIELPSVADLTPDDIAVVTGTFAAPHAHDGWFRSAVYAALERKAAYVDVDADGRTDTELKDLLGAVSRMRDEVANKTDGDGRASFYADLAAGIDEELLSRKAACKDLNRIVSGIEPEPGDDDWTP